MGATADATKGNSMPLKLAEFVADLRSELVEAMRAAEGESLQFELGPVEVELTIAVDKEAKPGAKVKFWVVEAGAEARIASTNTQKLKLRLDPKDRSRGGRPPIISGESVHGAFNDWPRLPFQIADCLRRTGVFVTSGFGH